MPSSEKGGYLPKALMSFPILASDLKSTRILFQDGREGDAAMTETGHQQRRGVDPGIPDRITDEDQPRPHQQPLGLSLPLGNERARPVLGCLG